MMDDQNMAAPTGADNAAPAGDAPATAPEAPAEAPAATPEAPAAPEAPAEGGDTSAA